MLQTVLLLGTVPLFLFSQTLPETTLHPFGRPNTATPDCQTLRYQAFECGYLQRVKLSLWVAYCYYHNPYLRLPRYQGKFMPDTFKLKKRAAVFPTVYESVPATIRFKIDRGHLAPDAALKTFGRNAQKETYFLTNITPQFANTNRYIWADLEKRVRRWAGENDTVWVVVGPLFYPQKETLWLGTRNVPIPHAHYCVAFRLKPFRLLAFIVPNDSIRRYGQSLTRFLVSIDSIEKLTQINLLPALAESLEQILPRRLPADFK